MNNFGKYMTAAEAKTWGDANGDKHDLKYWKNVARGPAGRCGVCQTEDEWLYGQCGMCFTCTTGEADASEDVEITP